MRQTDRGLCQRVVLFVMGLRLRGFEEVNAAVVFHNVCILMYVPVGGP